MDERAREHRRLLRKKYIKDHTVDFVIKGVSLVILVAVLLYVCRGYMGRGVFVAVIYAMVTAGNEYKNYRHNFLDPEMKKFLEEQQGDRE